MKIQPIDVDCCQTAVNARPEPAKPVLKSRLKRLFDRQFHSVLRNSTAEKPPSGGETQYGGGAKDGEFEPSSVCLDKMVQNYIEESNEKPFRGRHRCNCFNGNNIDSSDDEFDVFVGGFGDSIPHGSSGDASDVLKSLIPCASVAERNLLADASMIVERNKNCKQKDSLRKIIAEGLSSLGYDCSICRSKWEKFPTHPAGEYEYVDVIIEGERILIDVDFRSEFEIARSTGAYKAILQSLPFIFVGKSDRLGQIVSVVSEAAKLSLKKKGMHFPPWRRAEYMRAKWLSSYTRQNDATLVAGAEISGGECVAGTGNGDFGELELIFGGETAMSGCKSESPAEFSGVVGGGKAKLAATWQPPALKSKSVDRRANMVTGLASLLKEKS